MIDTSFLNQMNRFELVMKKRVHSKYSGSRASQSVGDGLQFMDYREYVPGDDYRAIDWKVFARTDKFFIRRYEEERNLTLHILVDSSASMDFGESIKKFEYASMIGLGFAYLAMKNNEKFEFSTFSDKLNFVKPKKGKNQIISIIDNLHKMDLKGKSNFEQSLMSLKNKLKTKSMIVLISDFLFDPAELEHTLHLFKRSELVVVQVLDDVERNMGFNGDNLFIDAETQTVMRTYVSNRMKNIYTDKLEQHIYKIKSLCDNVGAKFITVDTNTPIFETFYTILK